MTLRTIQPIGKKPVTAPSSAGADRHAGRHGEDEDGDAVGDDQRDDRRHCALTLFDAIRTSSVTTGSAAAQVDRILLLSGS